MGVEEGNIVVWMDLQDWEWDAVEDEKESILYNQVAPSKDSDLFHPACGDVHHLHDMDIFPRC